MDKSTEIQPEICPSGKKLMELLERDEQLREEFRETLRRVVRRWSKHIIKE